MLNDSPYFHEPVDHPTVHWHSLTDSVLLGNPLAADQVGVDSIDDQILQKVDAPSFFKPPCSLPAPRPPLDLGTDDDLLKKIDSQCKIHPAGRSVS